MPYTLHEHTADVRLEITSESFSGLFSESVRAMNAVEGPEPSPEAVLRPFSVDAPDRVGLLVDFLNELLSLAHLHHECYDTLEMARLDETHVSGVARGWKTAAPLEEIKAATWHEASVTERGGIWKATFVLDI